MVWGAHLSEGESFTHLKSVFSAIENEQQNYDFLLIGIEACPCHEEYEFINHSPVWLTGQELTELVERDDLQWIWGAFLAFPKSVGRERAALETSSLYTPRYPDKDSWSIRTNFAKTKADFMILAGDSSYMELLSKEQKRVDCFCKYRPLAERFILDDTHEES